MPTAAPASPANPSGPGATVPVPVVTVTLGLTLLLGLLSAVGPISTDIYLPAFPMLDRDFGRVGAAQITLAAWFAGLAAGQLVQGALSDRLGRRIPLLYGTLIYSAASLGCAVAPGVAGFSAFRVLAAFSGSASMVIPRALIRDVTEGIGAARLLSRLTLVLGVVPILAPAVGGLMLTVMNWRDLFWAAGLYGVACTVLVWRFLPDTLPPERRLRHTLPQMLTRYLLIAREPVFRTNAMVGSFAFAAVFTFIGGSAVVYTRYFHLSPPQYGLLFGLNALGFISASQLAARAASRFGMDRVIRVGARTMFAAYATALAIALAGGGLVALDVPILVGQFMLGLMAPLWTVNALSRHRDHAGSASALMGTWQFGMAALAGMLVGHFGNGTPARMTLLMVLVAAPMVIADWLRPPSAPMSVAHSARST